MSIRSKKRIIASGLRAPRPSGDNARAMRTDCRIARARALAGAFFAAAALAGAQAAAQELRVEHAWVRAPSPGQSVAAAYMEITASRSAAVIGAESPLAGRVELHRSTVEQGVMRMRPVARIEPSAGQPVKLAPGGLHLMLFDVKEELRRAASVPIVLRIEVGGETLKVPLEASVRSAPPASGHGGH
jgi:copper(I)-binding protein